MTTAPRDSDAASREHSANQAASSDAALPADQQAARPAKPARSHRRGPSPTDARSKARRAAVQALYQWDVGGGDELRDIERQFIEDREMRGVNLQYFHQLLFEIPARIDELDPLFKPLLDRAVASLDPVERAVLRIGVYELAHCPDVPVRVAINEGVELSKRFGAEQSHTYINAVLDGVAKQLRKPEMDALKR